MQFFSTPPSSNFKCSLEDLLPSVQVQSPSLSSSVPPSQKNLSLSVFRPLSSMKCLSLCEWRGEAIEARCPPLELQNSSAVLQFMSWLLNSNFCSPVKNSTLLSLFPSGTIWISTSKASSPMISMMLCGSSTIAVYSNLSR